MMQMLKLRFFICSILRVYPVLEKNIDDHEIALDLQNILLSFCKKTLQDCTSNFPKYLTDCENDINLYIMI